MGSVSAMQGWVAAGRLLSDRAGSGLEGVVPPTVAAETVPWRPLSNSTCPEGAPTAIAISVTSSLPDFVLWRLRLCFLATSVLSLDLFQRKFCHNDPDRRLSIGHLALLFRVQGTAASQFAGTPGRRQLTGAPNLP